MSALELQRLSTPVLAGCCGLIGGGILVVAASNLSPVIAGLAMCGLLVAVAIMFSPSLGLLLTAAVIPIERLGRLTADTNMYTVSLMRIIGLLALASFLVHAVHRKWKFRFGKPFFAYLVYCGLAILTVFYTTDPLSTVRSGSAILGNLIFFFLVINMVRSWRLTKAALLVWLASSVLVGVYTMYDWHFGRAVNVQRIGELQARFQTVYSDTAEWQQLFTESWRLERDYFYDPNMHGVDWNKVRGQYSKMLEGVSTREEVNFVIGEMIGELNSSHTYRSGGDEEHEKQTSVGYLGVDWQAEGQYYKIKRIVRGAVWDAEARSPLDMPGIAIKEGNYILAVNGLPLTTEGEPFAAFQGLGGKTVELTFNTTPSWQGAKTAIVETLKDEARLRHLEWIEKNRKRVEDATHGEAGYVYVRSTGVDGQSELILRAGAEGVRFVLYAAKPLGEKIFPYGPFIADRQDEIQPLYQKYRSGKMEHISEAPESQRITY